MATYYQLLNLADDCDLKDVLRFLGQREIVHYQRFGEALMDIYEFTECKETILVSTNKIFIKSKIKWLSQNKKIVPQKGRDELT